MIVLPGVTIGRGVTVGAGSVVTKGMNIHSTSSSISTTRLTTRLYSQMFQPFTSLLVTRLESSGK